MKIFESLKNFIGKCKRVWLVLKKPTRDEFLKVAKVAAAGIGIIGILGFGISLIMKLIIG